MPLTPLDGSEANHFLVIGQVVSIYVDDAFIKDGRVDTGAMHPLMRGGYFDYFSVTDDARFELKRPPRSRSVASVRPVSHQRRKLSHDESGRGLLRVKVGTKMRGKALMGRAVVRRLLSAKRLRGRSHR